MAIADTQARDKVPVTLAGRDFVVKVVPMARVRRLADVVVEALKQLEGVDAASDQQTMTTVVDKLLEFPHRLLSLFIDGLPEDIFADEENGVTFPEFWQTLQIALTINRVDQLKNVFSRLTPMLMQASQSPKTSS